MEETQATLTFFVPAKNLKGVMTYLKPEVYEQLKLLAEAEDRSISNLLARIAADWVRERQSENPSNSSKNDGE